MPTMYGLRSKKTGDIVCYESTSNGDAEFCVSTQYTLDTTPTDDASKYWMVCNAFQAEWVRQNSTDWYNADMFSPTHPRKWNPDDYEVVAIEIKVRVKPVVVKIPSAEEYLKEKYEASDPKQYAYFIKELKAGSLYVSYHTLAEFVKSKSERK